MDALDPSKWAELLKASGWQLGAVAIGLFALTYLNAHGWLPISLGSPWPEAVLVGAFICCALALASLAAPATRAYERRAARREQQHETTQRMEAVRRYIPQMTQNERAIIASQLAKNERAMTLPIDGGRASTLVSLGIIALNTRPGQAIDIQSVPHIIPQAVWAILKENEALIMGAPGQGRAFNPIGNPLDLP